MASRGEPASPGVTAGAGHGRPSHSAGFTMVELIVVLILAGILGAIGAARFFSRSGFDAAAFAGRGAAMLRYAQKLAIAQNRPVFVQAGAQGIALCYEAAAPCGAGQRVASPAGANGGSAATRAFCADAGSYLPGWECEAVPAGASMAVTPAAAGVFFFNGLGRPYLATDSRQPGADSGFSGLTLAVSAEGASSSIVVSAETGHVD